MQRRKRHRDIRTVGLAIYVPTLNVQRASHAFEVVRRDPGTEVRKIDSARQCFPPARVEGARRASAAEDATVRPEQEVTSNNFRSIVGQIRGSESPVPR